MNDQEQAKKRRLGGSRFVYSPPPSGFGAELFYCAGGDDCEAHTVSGFISIDGDKEGPPAHIHGGALTTLVDEAMGAAAWYAGYRVLAVNLNVNFRRPVPVGARVHVVGRVTDCEGRKVFTSGEITLPSGEVAVQATGLFVLAPELFASEGGNPFDLGES